MNPTATMNGSRNAASTGGTTVFSSASESATTSARAGPVEADAGHQHRGDVDRGGEDRQRDEQAQQPDPGRRRFPLDRLAVGLGHARSRRTATTMNHRSSTTPTPSGSHSQPLMLAEPMAHIHAYSSVVHGAMKKPSVGNHPAGVRLRRAGR